MNHSELGDPLMLVVMEGDDLLSCGWGFSCLRPTFPLSLKPDDDFNRDSVNSILSECSSGKAGGRPGLPDYGQ